MFRDARATLASRAADSHMHAWSPRRKAGGVAIIVALVCAVWLEMHLGIGRGSLPEMAAVDADGSGRLLSGEKAGLHARRMDSLFRQTQNYWQGVFRDELARDYAPAETVMFIFRKPGFCEEVTGLTGPGYCPSRRTAAFDLFFVEQQRRHLREIADLGEALMAGLIAAAHAQREAGIGTETAGRTGMDQALVLQADCLAGVWAGASAGELGPVPAGHYRRMLTAARRVLGGAEDRAAPGASASALLMSGPLDAREAAFAAGYAEAEPVACARG